MKSIITSLECPVCLQLYSKPRVLTSCGHSICTLCIEKLSSVPSVIECPICKEHTHYASVEDIHVNFTLLGVIEEVLKNEAVTVSKIREEIPEKEVADYFSRNRVAKQSDEDKTPWWNCWCLKED